jgi:hypothetical protein
MAWAMNEAEYCVAVVAIALIVTLFFGCTGMHVVRTRRKVGALVPIKADTPG